MLKKLLILPLLWGILWLGAFASADYSFVADWSSDYSPNSITFSSEFVMPSSVSTYVKSYSCDPWYFANLSIHNEDYSLEWVVECNCEEDWSIVFGDCTYSKVTFPSGTYIVDVWSESSFNSITISDGSSSSSDSSSSDSSLWIPSIPSSFTSGLTSLVNNFWSTIASWLPTIILVALGIYAVFALFRVVRNYARSSFRG